MKYIELSTEHGPMILMLNWITHIVPMNGGTQAAVYLGSGHSHLHHGSAAGLIESITQKLNGKTP
jgi:hypothetical protein